jgi:hypothetical protein
MASTVRSFPKCRSICSNGDCPFFGWFVYFGTLQPGTLTMNARAVKPAFGIDNPEYKPMLKIAVIKP